MSSSADGGLQPHVMAILARQLRQLSTAPPPGVRYLPSDASLTEVLCELEGPRGTPYEGGSFTCRLVLGGDFPNAPPKGASCCGARGPTRRAPRSLPLTIHPLARAAPPPQPSSSRRSSTPT